MPTTVTLSWEELPIDERLLKEAIAEATHGRLLEDELFRVAIVEKIKEIDPALLAKAVAESVNHDLLHFLRSQMQPLKDELNAVVKDFDHMERAHASEYAARRKQELLNKLSALNSL